MSAIGLVIAIAVPISLVLFAFVIWGRKQQASNAKREQARLVKQKADDLLEALEFLILVDNHQEIQQVVLDRVVQLYERANSAMPKADKDAPAAQAFDVDEYRQKISQNQNLRKVFKSDRELRYGRRQLTRILKTLGPLAKGRVISETAMLEYRRYLRMTMLEREVDTYTAQGDVAGQRGDVLTASNYYKAAKKLLIEFDLQYPEKTERIRELAQRTAALYNSKDNVNPNDALSRALSKEEAAEASGQFGIPTDPSAQAKKKF
ncbi:MAG: hypothetical protein VB954_02065 [Thalassolituus sp.]|mgnify:FL=1|jgi:hypothetical protein|uniref:DNA topoisomerase I n=1 Tax=Thalassolituus oleivorans MIL-1 TaxID=1298593 RepID=M5DQB2_9GAMM|nr:hypothetical protein [Thalassolituus oleivorans]MDF1639999.1 hypothetical protein [Thalassolituus oleivorans]PCI48859.1 MAG: hypothetical protein COB43_07420 [Oceanospirillales bacterium]CCU71566.1 hypothetical protein TOL_1132 [Thalassolituus oleivorans MIL-1]